MAGYGEQINKFKKELKNAISSQFTDQEKQQQLKQILVEIKKRFQSIYSLEFILDLEMVDLINNHINNCSTPIELILLDILDFAGENGTYKNNCDELIYKYFYYSSISTKIEELLKKKVIEEEEENKDLIFSDCVIKLTKLYLHTLKIRQIKFPMMYICIKVLDKNCNILFNRIKNQKLSNEEMIIKKEDNYQIDNDLQQLLNTVEVVELILFKFNNQYRVQYNLNMQKFIRERIPPLIYFNCPIELNCQFNITIPPSITLQQLQKSVYQSIENVITNCNNDYLSQILIDHNLYQHLTLLITSFEQSNQINNKQQLTLIQQSPTIISAAFSLLSNLPDYSDNCQLISSTPNFIYSLVQLIKYQMPNHFKLNQDQQQYEIRSNTRNYLLYLTDYGKEITQQQLTNEGYAGVLSFSLSTAGGSGFDYQYEISGLFWNLSKFIKNLINGRNYQTQFPPQLQLFKDSQEQIAPQLQLFKDSQEQIELEGGNEEIESYIFDYFNKQGGTDYQSHKQEYYKVKIIILNAYVDPTNPSNPYNIW